MIGQKLNNRYKIISLLGQGGMSDVYLADDQQTNKQVAVKFLARQLTLRPELLERFRREAETLRQLDHPNIVKFVDSFSYEDQFAIVMEYVSGGNLQDLIKTGPLAIELVRQIALDLCDALIRAHRLNIIHRDLKPENILLTQDGIPKLADFGVARLGEGTSMTRSGTQVGTPYYMAPEAWEGKTLDAQADIWSLGIILFEMLAGQVPFGGETGAAVMNKVLTSQSPDIRKLRTEVPRVFVKIIQHMLTRDKKRRYSTVREVALQLERVQHTSSSHGSTNINLPKPNWAPRSIWSVAYGSQPTPNQLKGQLLFFEENTASNTHEIALDAKAIGSVKLKEINFIQADLGFGEDTNGEFSHIAINIVVKDTSQGDFWIEADLLNSHNHPVLYCRLGYFGTKEITEYESTYDGNLKYGQLYTARIKLIPETADVIWYLDEEEICNYRSNETPELSNLPARVYVNSLRGNGAFAVTYLDNLYIGFNP